LKTIVQVR